MLVIVRHLRPPTSNAPLLVMQAAHLAYVFGFVIDLSLRAAYFLNPDKVNLFKAFVKCQCLKKHLAAGAFGMNKWRATTITRLLPSPLAVARFNLSILNPQSGG